MALAVASSTIVGRGIAQAADTVQCGATASVFAAETGGRLWLYPLNAPATSTSTWDARQAIGSGWNIFGRVLGGPDGRLYGIKSTGGLWRYRWTGTSWEPYRQISPGFGGYATAGYRNKITVDERGDFYLIDGNGKLRWYRYDEATDTWPIFARVIDNDWDTYDLLVAGGLGVLYARTADGKLYRHRFEPTSQRWIDRNRQVGTSGWNGFSKGMFSVGGDTLFGIQADGDLFQYRYREDTNTWAIAGRQIGNGWQNFANVTATTDTCHLNVSYTPALPQVPLEQFTPTNAMQASPVPGAALGTLEYAYTDNIGRLVHGRQDPDNVSSAQWTVLSGNEAFTGEPALTQNGQGLVQVLGHNVNSDVWSRTQAAAGSPSWTAWSDLDGAMRSHPTVVRLSDGSQVAFALDADGTLWARPQDGATGELMAWRRLGGTGLTGTPVAVAVAEGAATVVASDANGTVQVATYRNRTLSAWTGLGGSGFTGTPAVVLLPGYTLRMFARDANGQIMTQQQDAAGGFPGTWNPVGSTGFSAAGSPAALLSPVSGRIGVYVRGADGYIYYSGETVQGSGTWGNWIMAQEPVETYATDPTAFAYTNSNGTNVAYVVRTSANQVRLYNVVEFAGTSTATGADTRTGSTTRGNRPAFVRNDLPLLAQP